MNYVLYVATVILLIISYKKDRKKTKKALKKALKAFENILPQLLSVMVLVGVILAIFDSEAISKIIGAESGWIGTGVAAVVGAITLIPGFVAFPTSAILLENGAGYMQIGVFVSTLMMVGVVTLPIEIKYFGKKVSILRNILAFLFCFIVAYIIERVASGKWF